MIGKITIECTAENPNIPLKEIVQFQHSSSAIEIVKTPDLIGKWKVIGMSLCMIYPDNRMINKVCSKAHDSWVVTMPKCDVAGNIENGYSVIAQIQDENGIIRNDFVIGCGNVKIIAIETNTSPETTKNYLHAVDSISSAQLGDFYSDSRGLTKYLTSRGWKTISVDLSGYATEGWVNEKGFLTSHQSLAGYVTNETFSPFADALTSTVAVIPNEASLTNQLADKAFVNSSITTNTAYFKGTFNHISALPTTGVTPNDYAFVIRTDSIGQTYYDRYKYTALSAWLFEYSINNSGFTAVQYSAINSGITDTKVNQIDINTANIGNKCDTSAVYQKSELSTVVLSGVYQDDTTFSFNLIYKL